MESLSASADLLSGRDLLALEDLTDDAERRELLAGERRRVAGVDLGWEVDRHLRTRLVYQPRLSDGIRTSVQVTTIYLSERNADLIEARGTRADSALMLLRNVDGQRNLVANLSVDPGRITSDAPGGDTGARRLAQAFDPLSFTYSNGLTSRFNREAVRPSAIYELGWGRRDDFLAIGADTASTLSERDRVTVRGGMRLPGSTSVRLSFDRARNDALDTRSDREDLRRVWPDVRATVGEVAIPGFLTRIVDRLSVSSGYRKVTRSLAFGEGTQQDRYREDREVPMSLTLALTRGVTLSYEGRLGRGESRDPTGDTRRRADAHSLLMAALLRSPVRAFRERGAPMRVTVSVRYGDELECRLPDPDSPCVAFIDQLERDVALSLDSTVRDFQLGVRVRYLDRRSFVGQRAGSTQFQLNVFGRFLLTSDLLRLPSG